MKAAAPASVDKRDAAPPRSRPGDEAGVDVKLVVGSDVRAPDDHQPGDSGGHPRPDTLQVRHHDGHDPGNEDDVSGREARSRPRHVAAALHRADLPAYSLLANLANVTGSTAHTT
jgi:hypothetical protein